MECGGSSSYSERQDEKATEALCSTNEAPAHGVQEPKKKVLNGKSSVFKPY